MPSNQTISINDYDGQTGVVGWNLVPLDITNLVDQTTAINAFIAQIELATLGVVVSKRTNIQTQLASNSLASSDENAQRGNKWRISYYDDLEFLDSPTDSVPNPGYLKPFDMEIPTADLSQRVGNSNVVFTLDGGTVGGFPSGFVTAMQATVRSPYGGNIVVTLIEAVTRSGG